MVSNLAISQPNSSDRNAVKNLDESSLWLIENGLYFLHDHNLNALQDFLVDTFNTQIWVRPDVSDYRSFQGFRIKYGGYNADNVIIQTNVLDSIYYEYWVSKKSSQPSVAYIRDETFFITKSLSEYGTRSIIERSNNFIPTFKVGDFAVLSISKDDLSAIYALEPWNFPKNFANSQIKDLRVYADKGHGYRVAP